MRRLVWVLCMIWVIGIQCGFALAGDLQAWKSQQGAGPYTVLFDGQVYRNRWWVGATECPADAGPANWSNAWEPVRSAAPAEIDALGNPASCQPSGPEDAGGGGDRIDDWAGTQALVGSNPLPWPRRIFAPYVDGTMAMPDLAGLKRDTGAGHFVVAFIVTPSADDCTPSWGGAYRLEDFRAADGGSGPDLYGQIRRLREAGGDVMVSIGGAHNYPLAAACQDAETLKELYQTIITRLNLRALDFDIEGAHLADTEAIERHSRALRLVQDELRQEGRSVSFWYTLPSLPSGLTIDGLNVLHRALNHGVELDGVNIMAMDTYDAACESAGQEGQGINANCAISAAQSLHAQLKTLYSGKSDAALWRMIGVTPMIGVNDNPREVFYPSDADRLLDFARQKGLGLISMWSLGRDMPAPGGLQGAAAPTHSGLSASQAPAYAFTETFGRYDGNEAQTAEASDDGWPAQEAPLPPASGMYPPFTAGTTYRANDIVTHAGDSYQCKPWPYTAWCSVGGPYEPGVGWAWEQAWNLLQ